MPEHDTRHRMAARHNRSGHPASVPMMRYRRPVSHAVDKFTPVSRAQAATVAYVGTRGLVSPALGYGNPFQDTVTEQPERAASQARIAGALLHVRDRRRIDGAGHPNGSEFIGRPVLSPIIWLGGSDY